MGDIVWERNGSLQRELAGAALGFFLILSILFFPFVWGRASLTSASRDVPSIYPNGAAGAAPPLVERMLLDDVGSGAAVEPADALAHHILADEHVLPIWNRDLAFGTPLAAAMQPGAFCPFNLPAILHPSPRSDAWYVVIRLFVAALFTFLYLRYFLGGLAAFAGACTFMLTGYFILFCSMPHLSIECLIPLTFYFAERLIRDARLSVAGWLAVSIFLLGVGGFPEATLLSFGFVTVYFCYRLPARVPVGASRRKLIAFYAMGAGVGFACAAFLLVPFAEFVSVSFSAHPSDLSVVPRGVSDVDANWTTLFGGYLIPMSLGPIWHGLLTAGKDYNGIRGYWGVAAFFFALIAILQGLSRRLRPPESALVLFFSVSAIILVAKRFGSPFVNWIGFLPILRQVVFNKYDEPLIGFSVAVLCAIGVDELVRREVLTRVWSIVTIATLAVLTGSYYRLRDAIDGLAVSPYFVHAYEFAIVIFVVTLCAAFALLKREDRGRIGQLLARAAPLVLVGIIFFELSLNFFIPTYYVVNVQPNAATNPYAGAPYVAKLAKLLRPGERMFAEQNFLWPDWPEAFNLADIRDLDAIYDERYLPFVKTFVKQNDCDLAVAFVGCQTEFLNDPGIERLFVLSGVRYVVTPREIFDAAFVPVYQEDATIYRFNARVARARLYHDVRVMPDSNSVLQSLADKKTDVTRSAFLEANDSPAPAFVSNSAQSDGRDTVRFDADVSQHVGIESYSSTASLLVLSDTYYPGWNAYVDGLKTRISRANYLFRAVPVPAGRHRIDFRYEPRSYAIGFSISALGFLLLGAMFIVQRFPVRKLRFKQTVD